MIKETNYFESFKGGSDQQETVASKRKPNSSEI